MPTGGRHPCLGPGVVAQYPGPMLHLLAAGGLDPTNLLVTFGTIGLFAIIFAETGLLIGFFLPGDSILFTAGLVSAAGSVNGHDIHLNLAIVLPGVIIAAILGAETGYTIGHRAGPRLFSRPESRLFRQEFVERARHHFDRFGPTKAVILARFVPIVRTFVNPMAGVVDMERRRFTMANIAGGFLWAGGVTLAGYELGDRIKNVDRYLLPIIGVVILISLLPIAFEVLRSRREKRAAAPEREAA